MVKKWFSKPIRGSITRIFSVLCRKNEKNKVSKGVAVAGTPTGGSATDGWAELGTQIRVFFHFLFLRLIIERVNEFELL
jgi:hypothetical protein